MEYYNQIDNLKKLKEKILTKTVAEIELLDFLKDFNKQQVLNNLESNLLSFEIYYLAKLIKTLSPLLLINLDVIPVRLISAEQKGCNLNIIKETKEINKNDSLADLKEKIIQKWSPFKKEDNPGLIYPAPGADGNVRFNENDLVPGESYFCDVKIDSEGNILDFISGPTKIIQAESYEEIYNGLVGQLFDFQK